jgi:hypothetical protein
MIESRYLEDFRHNEYLDIRFLILSDSRHPKIEMTYNYYSMHGFYGTSDDLNDLENEKNFINNGKKTLSSIALWYLAFEGFINSLCKVVCHLNGKKVDPILRKEIGSRFSFLIKELQYNEMKIKKSGIYNRMNEFRQYRNELFHDRNIGEEINFSKTNFSSIPFMSNQTDTFQAILIYLEVVTLFRYVFTGLDIMPNISIGNSSILHFDKLDSLYNKYLRPYFEKVLVKHNLKTKLNLDIANFASLPPSEIVQQGEIVIIGRREQEEKFKHALNQSQTTIGLDTYTQIVKDYNLPEGHTSGENFIIDWESFRQSKFPMRR